MKGKSRVERLAVFEQISDALHLPGRLLGLARRSREPELSPVAPLPMGLAADSDLMALDTFRGADRQTGGGRLYAAVVQHLVTNIGPRLVAGDGGPKVFAAAAALTEMAGWMAHDSARDDVALRCFTRALPLARVCGDLSLAASIAASSSHLTLHSGDPAAAARWAQTGLEIAAQGPRLAALTARLHTMKARATAACGHRATAEQSLAAAREHLAPLCFSRSCNGATGLRARYDCVPSVERMTWGVVSPGPAGAVGDADERPGHRPVRRNAGQRRGRQVCITWMREHGATTEAGTVNTCGRVRCSTSKA
ncbi:hypothetical protein [Streptomyces sp. NBC_00239]|uniref:hypothetical protein n=1 Tax=Streptomyces sp. NBC_00239 TaxID=2903640 RepID=UPI002E2CFBBB|nr:hypothetical protein [Streptomyces sp. NBC_00239]